MSDFFTDAASFADAARKMRQRAASGGSLADRQSPFRMSRDELHELSKLSEPIPSWNLENTPPVYVGIVQSVEPPKLVVGKSTTGTGTISSAKWGFCPSEIASPKVSGTFTNHDRNDDIFPESVWAEWEKMVRTTITDFPWHTRYGVWSRPIWVEGER